MVDSVTPHGDLLRRKTVTAPELGPVLEAYDEYVQKATDLSITTKDAVLDLTEALNEYRRQALYVFEGAKNVPQQNLRSTVIEEFLAWLFRDIFELLDLERPSNYRIGKSNSSYLELTFAPKSFGAMFIDPNARIHKKDQDFALGAYFDISISPSGEDAKAIDEKVLLPVVAIECKTYLAKNHLDMCSSTAASLRNAMPYCMYIIVAEFLKMDKRVTPEFTDVTEIFVLCKAKNVERQKRKNAGLPPHDIDGELVWQLFELVINHLKRIWWDPDSSLERGRIIGRP